MKAFKALLVKTTCEHVYSTKFTIIKVIMQLQWALHLHWICWILFLLKQLCTLVCSIPHWVLNDISLHSKPFPFTAVVRYLVMGPWSHPDKQYLKVDVQCFGNCQCLHHSHFVNPFQPDTTKCLADISLAVEASRLYGQRKQSTKTYSWTDVRVWHPNACVFISYWLQDYNMLLGEPIWT
jgi:hypothetical protein